MNNRQNGRRRGRGGQQARNGQPGGPDRGNRLDNRARGNAAQLLEKYKNLARDAQMQGDRVNTEYYLQFADHYFRVLNENRARFEEQRPRQQADDRDDFGGDEDGGENGRQQRYQAEGDQGGDENWDDGEQPVEREQRPPRRERQAYRNDEDGEREERAERPERPERGNRDSGAREGGPREGRGRRNGNANGNGNGGGAYANGNGNGFSAPDFLNAPLAPRFEFQADDADEAPAEAAPAPAAEEPAPKPRRARAPRKPRGEDTAEA